LRCLFVCDVTILLFHSMAEPASAFSMAEPTCGSWWRRDTRQPSIVSSPPTLWASSTWWQDLQVVERHTLAINYIYIIEPKQAYPNLMVLCRFFDGISSVLWPSIPSKLRTKGHNSFWEFSKEKFVTNSQKLRT
jgi:hypothetical protein